MQTDRRDYIVHTGADYSKQYSTVKPVYSSKRYMIREVVSVGAIPVLPVLLACPADNPRHQRLTVYIDASSQKFK